MDFDAMSLSWDTERRISRAKVISREILNCVNPDKNICAMEFGCGTGLISFNLSGHFKNIEMIDSSAGMIEILKEKIARAEISHMHPLLTETGREPDFGKKYDLIYTSMVLHHIADVNGQIKQFSSMLIKNGQLCIVDLNEVSEDFHRDETAFEGHHGFNQSELTDILKDNGFRDVKSHTFFYGTKKVGKDEVPYSLFLIHGRAPLIS